MFINVNSASRAEHFYEERKLLIEPKHVYISLLHDWFEEL